MERESIEPHTEYVRDRVHCRGCGVAVDGSRRGVRSRYCPDCGDAAEGSA